MLEFWFEFGSNYSYLSVMRIEALAARYAVPITWRPFLLAPIFKSFGWETSPFILQKEKGQYVWRDMARRSEKYGIPWRQPTVFPRRALLPIRVALIGADQPWMSTYCKQIMLMNFAQDREIDSLEAVTTALQQAGVTATDIIAAAQSEENKLALRRQTEEAKARGVFGAPTFFVDNEMFWGDDRLEDALAWATKATPSET
jgi:2-hydroxychromene-2-carboxylate isomerase